MDDEGWRITFSIRPVLGDSAFTRRQHPGTSIGEQGGTSPTYPKDLRPGF